MPMATQKPLFAIDKVQYQFSGSIVDLVTTNNIMIVVVERELLKGTVFELVEIDLTESLSITSLFLFLCLKWMKRKRIRSFTAYPIPLKKENDRVKQCFMSPRTHFVLITTTRGECFYLDRPSSKFKVISALKVSSFLFKEKRIWISYENSIEWLGCGLFELVQWWWARCEWVLLCWHSSRELVCVFDSSFEWANEAKWCHDSRGFCSVLLRQEVDCSSHLVQLARFRSAIKDILVVRNPSHPGLSCALTTENVPMGASLPCEGGKIVIGDGLLNDKFERICTCPLLLLLLLKWTHGIVTDVGESSASFIGMSKRQDTLCWLTGTFYLSQSRLSGNVTQATPDNGLFLIDMQDNEAFPAISRQKALFLPYWLVFFYHESHTVLTKSTAFRL